MSTAICKISVAFLADMLCLPQDCEIEAAAVNEDGFITVKVTHDSIPEGVDEVAAIVRRQTFTHEQVLFGHFLPAAEAEAFVAGVNSTATPQPA